MPKQHKHRKRRAAVRTAGLMVAMLSFPALAANETVPNAETIVHDSFFPYADGIPQVPGYAPGVTIDKTNVSHYQELLPGKLGTLVGEGYYALTTIPTRSLDLSQSYIAATLEHYGQPQLGGKTGMLENYVAGRPFPAEPDSADPRAGERIAWNMRRGYAIGDALRMAPFYWSYRDMESGKEQRRLDFEVYFMTFMGRVDMDPKPRIEPNPARKYSAGYLRALRPFDVRNTQLLIVRYEDDTKRDDSWLYSGFQRRVRRLATGQTTDSYLGSDLMIEDFGGYNARLSEYHWQFKGTRNVLLPFYLHDELPSYDTDIAPPEVAPDYKYVAFGGQGKCFPLVNWQLRKVYVVEATPLDPGHPLGKRDLYFDAQTFTLPYQDIYDRAGKHWKTLILGQADPDYYVRRGKPGGVAFFDAFTMLDLQARHCTTGQIYTEPNSPDARPDMFTVQYLRAVGQ